MRSQNFYEKWNGRLPAAGSPDEAIYQNELDVAITDDATLMKSVAIVGDESMGNPASIAQFQGAQLSSALGLEESQLPQLNEYLNRFYADTAHRKLNWESIPASGEQPFLESQQNPEGELALWFKNREEMSEKAFAEIQTILTPQQRTDLRRIYNPDFLWGANIGSRLPSP